MTINKFAKRVHNLYDTGPLQARVAHEELLKYCDFTADHGGATVLSGDLTSSDDAVSKGDLVDKVAGALSEPAILYHYRGRNVEHATLIEPDLVITFFFGSTGTNNITVTLANSGKWTVDKLHALLKELGYTVGRDEVPEDKARVSFAMPSSNGVRIIEKKFDTLPLDSIAANYSSEVVEQTRAAIELLKTAPNGILILNGPPGTGKSFLIRAMLWEARKHKAPVVCTPPQQFLTSMALLTDAIMTVGEDDDDYDYRGIPVSTTKPDGTLVVLEDIGELLTESNVTTHVDATSNLLNFADGLLSLLANTLFVLSFNQDIGKINPALTRPGRCLGQITVEPLGWEQAQELTDLTLPHDRYTLAEVYEMKRIGKPVKASSDRKLGFGV